MALHSLYCADVPLRNCSLTHSLSPHGRRTITLFSVPISNRNALPNPACQKYDGRNDDEINMTDTTAKIGLDIPADVSKLLWQQLATVNDDCSRLFHLYRLQNVQKY